MRHHIIDQHCKDVSIKFKDWYMEKVFATPIGELLEDDDALYELFLQENPTINSLATSSDAISKTKDYRL